MILPALLAAAIVVAPAAAAPAETVVVEAPGPERLEIPMSLKVKDASVVDLLEKFADLLGVTPILDPGIGGRISIEVRDLSVAMALEAVESAANVEISVSKKLLRARPKAGAETPGAKRPPAPARGPAARLGEVLRFWRDGSVDGRLAVRVPESAGSVEVPGCAAPVLVARLGSKAGGTVGIALATAETPGGRAKGRILGEEAADGTRVLVPGCEGRLLVEAGDPFPGETPVDPAPVPKGESLLLELRLLELTDEEETVLTAPKVAFRSESGFRVKSGFEAGAAGTFSQVADIHAAGLQYRSEEEVLLIAVRAELTRTPAAPGAEGTLVARRAETFELRKGKPLRWTVDSSWDRGRAAIVLELTLAGRFVAQPK